MKILIPKKEIRASLEALNIIGGGKPSGYIVKPRRKPVQREAQTQTALFEWANYNANRYPELALMYHVPNANRYPELALMYHVPNGGRRDAISGYHLKQQGVKSGVPDIVLPVARGSYHGLYIELKAQGGKLQESQRAWISELDSQGYKACVAYGFDEAVNILERYLNLKGENL